MSRQMTVCNIFVLQRIWFGDLIVQRVKNCLTWVWLKKEELGETFLAQKSQSRLGSRRSCNKELQLQKTGPKYSKNLQKKVLFFNMHGKNSCYSRCNLDLPRSLTSDPSSVVILSTLRSINQRLIKQIRHICIMHILLGIAHSETSGERFQETNMNLFYLLIRCTRKRLAQR